MAARFAAQADVISHNISGLAGAATALTAEVADVGGALAGLLPDLAEPAAADHVGQREGSHGRGGNPLLRMDAGVSRPAADLYFPALRADGPNGELGREPAVDVVAERRLPEIGRVHKARAPQPALFAHREQKGQRRVRQALFQ